MSETNSSESTPATGGLRALLPTNEIRVPLLTPGGDYSGISFFYAPMDARTDQQYTHILQRGASRAKSTNDEALQYVFKHKFTRVVFEKPAGNADYELESFGCSTEEIELFKTDPKRFFLQVAEMWRLVRASTYKYLNEVSPEAGDSKS